MAISLVERGLVDLKPLVTHRYKFKDALEAFRMTEKGKDESGKVGPLRCSEGCLPGSCRLRES
jgi:threonine dehydrogenase-like Zn-dependent dehydrogenase